MDKEQYGQYLASRQWALLRERVRRRARNRCERCKRAPMHNVHHRSYARTGHELLEDLIGLCDPCHRYESALSDIDPAAKK